MSALIDGALLKATAKKQARGRRRAERQRPDGTEAKIVSPSVPEPQPPGVSGDPSMVSEATSSSPMSTSGHHPPLAMSEQLPSSLYVDSSNKEGAHRPELSLTDDPQPPSTDRQLPARPWPDPPPPRAGPSLAMLSGAIAATSDALATALKTTPQTREGEGKQRSVVAELTTPMQTRGAAIAQRLWVESRPPMQPHGHSQATEPPEQARARATRWLQLRI